MASSGGLLQRRPPTFDFVILPGDAMSSISKTAFLKPIRDCPKLASGAPSDGGSDPLRFRFEGD
jgi:hypothetical protein